MIVCAVMVTVFSGPANAAVTGECVNCHTMHNSQGGVAMATFGGGTGPNATLLRGSCLGCHGQLPAGANNIITDIPQVSHADADALAGGNFKYVIDGPADSKGHNVNGLVAEDGTLGSDPPGYASAYDPASTPFSSASRLTCAGTQGCHGNRDVLSEYTAVSGAHHNNDDVLKFGGIVEGSQGATVATSYRFLYKVKGGEDSDWQNTTSATDHNEYKGATYSDARATMAWAGVDTISELCSECHGNFHLDAGVQDGNNDWIRHPADYIIPASGEYNTISTTYNLTVPVARAAIPVAVADGTVTAGTDIVMCLSCHRAHASEYADILRWDYSGMVAGTTTTAGTGCFVCHTGKDGV